MMDPELEKQERLKAEGLREVIVKIEDLPQDQEIMLRAVVLAMESMTVDDRIYLLGDMARQIIDQFKASEGVGTIRDWDRQDATDPRLNVLEHLQAGTITVAKACEALNELQAGSKPALPTEEQKFVSMATKSPDFNVTDFGAVGLFHEKFGLPNLLLDEPDPRDLPDELRDFRVKFLLEELTEYLDAMGLEPDHSYGPNGETGFEVASSGKPHDLAKAADALVDLVYVALGTAHLHGFPWPELFAEVQRANMSKERCGIDHKYVESLADDVCGYDHVKDKAPCGKPRKAHSLRGSQFDVIKPEGWTAPDIEGILRKYAR